MKKLVKMLNFGSSKLDHILSLGKAVGDHAGLGYTGTRSDQKTIFAKATNSFNPQEAKKQNSEISNMKFEEKSSKRKRIPRCHYCNHLGHIRPHCFIYLENLRKKSNKNIHSYTIGMIKEEDKFCATLKRESMLISIVLHKHDPRKMVNGKGYQARRKRNGKFVKKSMLDKMSNNMSHKKSNEICAIWKLIKGKYVGNTQRGDDSDVKREVPINKDSPEDASEDVQTTCTQVVTLDVHGDPTS